MKERAAELRAQGKTHREIALELGVALSTVSRWLNPDRYEIQRQKNRERMRGYVSEKDRELTALRVELANARSELAAARSHNRMLQQRLEEEKAKPKAMSLTELHGYWLANHSPDEIERIAAGLSGWEADSLREAA